ncbi:MAG: hypothetical protein ACYDHW_03990 [Syntrophorhabdaceae bacterium]
MNKRYLLIFVFLVFLTGFLGGCGIKLPADKAEYVGEWQSREMYLSITEDGSVEYKRASGGIKKSISGPLRSFEGNNFVVGISPIKTTFVVSEPPHQENGQWKMTVDNVTLTRTAH